MRMHSPSGTITLCSCLLSLVHTQVIFSWRNWRVFVCGRNDVWGTRGWRSWSSCPYTGRHGCRLRKGGDMWLGKMRSYVLMIIVHACIMLKKNPSKKETDHDKSRVVHIMGWWYNCHCRCHIHRFLQVQLRTSGLLWSVVATPGIRTWAMYLLRSLSIRSCNPELNLSVPLTT